MSKLISIGEVLIDFIPLEKGVSLKDVDGFKRVAGGAPANVAACVSRLGQKSIVLSKLGKDAFGDHLVSVLDEVGVDTSYILRTKDANTALAFVSLDKEGNRSFSFYRKPSADMLLESNEIREELFEENDVLHFCSVDLIESPMKYAHKKAIEYAQKNNVIISFDPNVRLPLWEDKTECRDVIPEFLPFAHIIKVSDEELEFITGTNDLDEALNTLMVGNVKVVIFTLGEKGAVLYTSNKRYQHSGYKVKVADTTGAGDSFIGSFIAQLLDNDISIKKLSYLDYDPILEFSNKVGSIVASKVGAIPSMPTKNEL